MNKPMAGALFLIAVAAFFPGCSSSDGTNGMFTPGGEVTESDVTTLMQTVVLPVLGGTADLTLEDENASLAPPPGADPCSDWSNLCQNEGEGTVERCAQDGQVTWSYSNCDLPNGSVAEGSVTRTGQLVNGSTTFAITIGDLALNGTVGLHFNSGCFERTYDGFSAVRPDHSVSIDGNVRCLLLDPSGEYHLDVVKPDASFSLDLDFDAEVGEAILTTADGTTVCQIDMSSGEADCTES